jgi:uncharacterized protein (DUF4415 family)
MTARSKDIRSNLEKVDRHVIQPHEYDEIPELTDEMVERGDLYQGDKLVRRGRPPLQNRKKSLTLRIDPEVIEAFKSGGPGWQTRMADVLKQAARNIK